MSVKQKIADYQTLLNTVISSGKVPPAIEPSWCNFLEGTIEVPTEVFNKVKALALPATELDAIREELAALKKKKVSFDEEQGVKTAEQKLQEAVLKFLVYFLGLILLVVGIVGSLVLLGFPFLKALPAGIVIFTVWQLEAWLSNWYFA